MSNWWVEPSGRGVGWIFFAGNVARDKSALVRTSDVVDAAENLVGSPVSAPSFPPALNDSPIVTEDPEELTWVAG